MRWFAAGHLQEGPIQWTSMAVGDLAREMEERLAETEDKGELVTGLRKLLEAKDAFVRAAVALPQEDVRAVILEGGPLDKQTGQLVGDPPPVLDVPAEAIALWPGRGEYRLDPERVSDNGAVYVWQTLLDLPPGVSPN